MSTDRYDDDRWDDRDDRVDEATIRRAKDKVSLPAKMLIAGAVFMILWAMLNIAVVVSGYDLSVTMLEYAEKQQPPGKQKDDLKKQIEEAKTRDRTPEYIQSAVITTLGLTLDVLILVGGLRMNSLRGRTLAIVGAICALIPANSCCCIGLPIGIWALIVLFNEDVKLAFAALKSGDGPVSSERDLR